MKRATEEELSKLIEIFSELEVEEIENPNSFFKHIGILDVYPRCLSIEEAALLLGRDHNDRHEPQYVQYFQRCLQLMTGLVYILKQPIFSELKRFEKEVYKVEDSKELLNLIPYIAREECFYNIYLMEVKTVVIGNFDLSWPIYSNSDNFKIFNEIAREVNLYIRNS
ncbi:hypothetical protein [Paenibacillus terrigena]|uniref:hypothetical protein n=1 Tax=Paenibacillus terrigena TaxID=369333 RepID=UPI00036E2A37|nr:hypothetical protein [Paenibacillus terrigena]